MIKLKDFKYAIDSVQYVIEIKTGKQDYFKIGTMKRYTKYTTEKLHIINGYNKETGNIYELRNGQLITEYELMNKRIEEMYIEQDEDGWATMVIRLREVIK